MLWLPAPELLETDLPLLPDPSSKGSAPCGDDEAEEEGVLEQPYNGLSLLFKNSSDKDADFDGNGTDPFNLEAALTLFDLRIGVLSGWDEEEDEGVGVGVVLRFGVELAAEKPIFVADEEGE